MTVGAERELILLQEAAVARVRVVAGHAFAATGRNMGKGRLSRSGYLVFVAFPAQIVDGHHQGKGIGCAGTPMTGGAVACSEGFVGRFPEKPGPC